MMAEWNYAIIAMSLLLLFFLLWKEVTRVNKLRLVWRIVASVLAVISLACIALPVTINSKKTVPASKEVILLTEGFNKDSVQKFINNTSFHLPVYTTDPAISRIAQPYKTRLVSYPEIVNITSEKSSAIHVFGYGLKQDELKQLNCIPIIFHPAEIPAGITSISWKQKLNSGEKLQVQGHYNNNNFKAKKIILSFLNTNLDSLIIPANSSKDFELSTIPKHIDKTVFTISVLQQKDTAEVEDIPVEVVQPKTFCILMLAAFPDFENKFLKEWLSQNGYSITFRTRISKDKFEKEFVNISPVALDRITPFVLDKFDVIIADDAELTKISKVELATIQAQVQNKGLGLIIKADSSINPSSFYAKNFSINVNKPNQKNDAPLHFKDSSSVTQKLIIDHSADIHSRPGIESLIMDERSSIFAANTIYGVGKIILTTLTNTYSLILSGNQESYNAAWSLLLNRSVEKYDLKESMSISPALPKVNEPAQLIINNANSGTSHAQAGEDEIYLRQDKFLPFLYTGTYWRAETGWMPYVNNEGKSNWFYIYGKDKWTTLNAFDKIRTTKKYTNENDPFHIKNEKIQYSAPVLVPKIYFFFIFILSVGFLWFEKKLS